MKKLSTLLLTILIATSDFASAQRLIQGKVTDASNHPLHHVSITCKEGNNSSYSDQNGEYQILVDSIYKWLIFKLQGFEEQEIQIKNRKKIDVVMKPEKISDNRNKKVCVAGLKSVASSCEAAPAMVQLAYDTDFNTENYSSIQENGFKETGNQPLSTFSIDVDNASYSNIRRFINMGQLPPKDAVRIEEMINYFKYDYKQPTGDKPFSVTNEIASCAWNENHELLLIGLQGKEIEKENIPPSNLVFLIDVSGSMSAPNKLPLVKSAMQMLVNELRPQDKVSIVVYAGAAGVVLDATPGTNKKKITEAIDNLNAGGSTAGGEGLKLAYKIAEENRIEKGNNRIILATDGDFNVGVSSDSEMEQIVTSNRDKGIFISVLGFGMGNYKDNKLEIISDKGNGNYSYIDNIQEARRIFIKEFGGTLFTIAKDVKLQIEFNPALVKAYRLIGYENRLLNPEDFKNDKKDAGEMGSGHQVTALYEIIPANSKETIPGTNPLKYQKKEVAPGQNYSNEMATIKFRYKKPDGNNSIDDSITIIKPKSKATETSASFKLAAGISQFGMMLRDSEFKGSSTAENTVALIREGKGKDEEGYAGELIRLIESAKALGMK
ncbi:MAG TPA: von Willebrand factor type A domain-containing protein [Prolixibacteraceae bacterium]|nr:von Willebrand factor type A domain-containing protein [Prolixibacteraceae bacterium]